MDDIVIARIAAQRAHAGLMVAVAVVAVSLAAPTVAVAAANASAAKKAPAKVVKPGDPGSSEYQEDVPSAFGSVPAASLLPRAPQTTGAPLPHAVARKLDHGGAAGSAAAALAVAGSPRPSAPAPHPRRGSHASAGGGSPGGGNGSSVIAQAGSGRGIVASIVHSAVGSSALLAVVLGISVLLAIAITIQRRRRSG